MPLAGKEFWMHPALCRPVIPACSEQSCQAEPCCSRLTSLYPTSKCLLETPSVSAFSGHPSSLRVTTASRPWFGNPTRRTGRLCSCRESRTGWAEQCKGAAFQGGRPGEGLPHHSKPGAPHPQTARQYLRRL